MSFLEARTEMSICNKALSRIMQQPLTGSLDDPANLNKHAARECRRWYKSIVRDLLTKHHWGMATKTQALVVGPVNVRSGEWAYAYTKPNDLAFPVTLAPEAGGAVVGYYHGLGYLLATLYGRPMFRYEGGIIYSAIPSATLEYVSFDISEVDFTEEFEQQVVRFLSAALALPVAKDREMAADYKNEAVGELNLAIANSLNQRGQTYGNGLTEAEKARAGYPVHGLENWGNIF